MELTLDSEEKSFTRKLLECLGRIRLLFGLETEKKEGTQMVHYFMVISYLTEILENILNRGIGETRHFDEKLKDNVFLKDKDYRRVLVNHLFKQMGFGQELLGHRLYALSKGDELDRRIAKAILEEMLMLNIHVLFVEAGHRTSEYTNLINMGGMIFIEPADYDKTDVIITCVKSHAIIFDGRPTVLAKVTVKEG